MAVYGLFSPEIYDDAQKADEAAKILAMRLDELEPEYERGWKAGFEKSAFVFRRTLRSVTEEYVADINFLSSGEARKLNEMYVDLHETYAKTGIFKAKDAEFKLTGPIALSDAVSQIGRKGISIQRYKGLGEMNPEQLWETTLDPNVRSLLQVKITHFDQAESVFSMLMGDIVDPRRDFIQDNALNVVNLDV